MALDHYVNHGRCIAHTVKALGYAGRAKLREWVHERYPETAHYVIGKSGRPRATFAYKRAAVYEPCTREGSAKEFAQKLDIDRVTLYNWKNQLLGREASASMKKDKLSLAESDRDKLEQQVETLKRDIHNLQLEHDLLNKVNELLKKGSGREPAFTEQPGKDGAGRNALVRNKSLFCKLAKVFHLALAIRENAPIVRSKLADIRSN